MQDPAKRKWKLRNPLVISETLKQNQQQATTASSSPAARTRAAKRTRYPSSAYLFSASLPPITVDAPTAPATTAKSTVASVGNEENVNTSNNVSHNKRAEQQQGGKKKPAFAPLAKMAQLKHENHVSGTGMATRKMRQTEKEMMIEQNFVAIATSKPRRTQPPTKRLRM